MRNLGIAVAVTMALVACGDGDGGGNAKVCTAVDNTVEAMSGNDSAARDDQLATLAQVDAEDSELRQATDDMTALLADGDPDDQFGATLARLIDRCDQLGD